MPLRDQAYTPASLFRLSSLVDPDRGLAHLRAWVSPAVGFPLEPLVGWRIPDPPVDVLDGDTVVWWTPTPDGAERLTLPIDLAALGGPVFAELGDRPDTELASWWCWVSVQVDDPGAPLTAAVVDRATGDRTLLARSSWPYTLGAGRITRLRLTGQAVVTGLRGVDASRFSPPGSGPSTLSPLPIPEGPWYRGSISVEDALTRAADLGPDRTGPLDPPRDHPLTFDDEWARVGALVHIGSTGTLALLESAYGTGDLPVKDRVRLDLDRGGPAQAVLGSVETAITGAADPGVARWLGLLTSESLDVSDAEVPYVWVFAARWAVPDLSVPVTKAPATALGDVLVDPPLARDWAAALAGVLGDTREDARTFVTPVGAGGVPDLPTPPDPVLDGPPVWEDRDHYGRRIRLRGPIPGPVALARDGDLRNPRIGTSRGERGLVQLPARAEGPRGLEGVLSDTAVPADTSVRWTVAAADEFGRWSEDAEVVGDPPERPGLPAPVVEAAFVAADHLPDTGVVVPGTVRVQVPLPEPGPGGLPIGSVRIGEDSVEPAAVVAWSTPAPSTDLGGTTSVTVTVWFVDANGAGPATTTTVAVRDPRRPRPIEVGPAVLWAGRPGPTGTAELALRLPPLDPGWTAYNVYLAEETALCRALGKPVDRDGLRAGRAKAIADESHRITDRGLFTLVETVTGRRFTTTLPGAVRTLRFLRVVPVTPAGREADFAASPLVPVAVPGPDRPPSPSLTVTAQARLRLAVHGVSRAAVERLAPGADLRYRVRQTLDDTGDPLYLPVVRTGTLQLVDGIWQAEVTPPDLAPFVRHTWQAEVCHPAETALAAALDRPTVQPLRETAGDPAPAAWSAPSTPVSGMLTTPIPPIVAVATLPGPVLTLRDAPVSRPEAVGPWRLRVWRRASDGALTAVDPVDGDGFTVTEDLAVHDPGWAGEGYTLQLVDPLGRAGPLTRLPSPLLATRTVLRVEESVTGSGADGALLTGTATSVGPEVAGPGPDGRVRFRTGNGLDLGEAPLGSARHVEFAEFAAGDGTAVAEYTGDARHAPSTSVPARLPDVPGRDGPPGREA
ncbi:hypothetical protein [Pseudonocardia alni]|uniref:hypothetical protein n=1 Tax=Pseudonocardia alni TaxID=33907 RepID=UPI00332DDA0F